MKYLLLVLAFSFSVQFATAQRGKKGNIPAATPAELRLKADAQRTELERKSIVSNVNFRSVGPTIMSGRVTDLAVDPSDPTHFYVAYASGGLWETHNNGMSLEPLFDQECVMTIGDIAVDWKTGAIWIGTGENNSSRSSYAGVGLYKSVDGGKTWEHKGLEESHHIGRILIHPTDPNTLWVASLGHLYSPNKERGLYKTTDGGTTWKQVLYVDDNSGAIDLIFGDDSDNPQVLYASTWHRERRAWNFVEAGAGSAIYKSTDAGSTWTLVSTKESGFPVGEGVGRIGLTADPSGKYVYALLDNQFRREAEEKPAHEGMTKEDFRTMTKDAFLALDTDKLESFLRNQGFPDKYTAESVKRMVKKDEIKPVAVTEYLEDANSLLFDTPVIGAEVYRSEDGGKTWKRTHDEYLEDVCYSYGYYFGLIRVSPINPQHVYIAGVPVLRSEDGGKTFKSINKENVHVDHHALWIDPNKEGHLILGNDGGINISYDNGETWFKGNSPAVGQFYTVNVDNATPYNIYGGLQDNGVWKGSSSYEFSRRWEEEGRYPYERLLGGDGMQVAVDDDRYSSVYTGFQFGNYYRISRGGDATYIQPKHNLGERPLRYNWQTPIHLSVHNDDILYMGSNKLHRSMDKGDKMKTISGDLTKGGKEGDVAYGTLTSIHESPLKFGLIYTGSDDGLIHVTKDGGLTWTKLSGKLPQDLWVTRVQASSHKESRVYASLNGYRWDDFGSYLYVSDDYGSTWKKIGTDLPHEPINVVKEDPVNENLIYVGTDNGMYISLDGGTNFMKMTGGLPAVAVHDLVIHPRDNDLVVGTHGRSIWIANVEELQMLTPELMASELHLFKAPQVIHSKRWGQSWSKWLETSSPTVNIPIYINSSTKEKAVKLEVRSAEGTLLNTVIFNTAAGLNYIPYHIDLDPSKVTDYVAEMNKNREKGSPEVVLEKASNGAHYLLPGTYTIIVSVDGKSSEGTLTVK